jgi:UDP-glucose 4-epimerase
VTRDGAVRRALVTGGAGFIGSHLADRLLSDGVEVVVYDNFSTGQRRFVEALEAAPNGTLVEGDVLDGDRLAVAMRGCDIVFHLAANADVRYGLEQPDRDLRQNTIGTFTVLDAMRQAGTRRIVFSSTGSVYGEPDVFPTPEDCPFPRQTSLYAASKLAGEGLVQAFCEGYGFSGVILRFVSILGERYTHGHLFDFYRKLLDDPSRLEVLGDGRQRKSYLGVADCLDAIMLLVSLQRDSGSDVYNLGTDEVTDVDRSIAAVCRHMGVAPELSYAGGARGWVGDSPLIHLDCRRLRACGWRPKLSIDDAVGQTLRWFDDNLWIFEAPS